MKGFFGAQFSRRYRFAKVSTQNLKRRAILSYVKRNTSHAPKSLAEILRPRLSPARSRRGAARACTGCPFAPAEGPNTKLSGGQSEGLPAAAAAPREARRTVSATAGCQGRGAERGAAGLAQRLRTQNARSPADPQGPAAGAAAPRPGGFGGMQGTGCLIDHPSAPGRSRSCCHPRPGSPRANKAPALTGGSSSLSPSPALVLPLLLPFKIQAQGRGRFSHRNSFSGGAGCPPRSAHGRAPAPSVRSGSGQRLERQTSSSRLGRGVRETPLLHSAPAAQPLPQPLPREARPGPGLQLTPLPFSSSSSFCPGGWERGGRQISHSDLSLEPSQREQSDYSLGKKRGGKGKKCGGRGKFPPVFHAGSNPAAPRAPAPRPAGSPIPVSPSSPPAPLHHHGY